MKLSRYYPSVIAALILISPIAADSAKLSQKIDFPEDTIVQISADVYLQEGVKKFSREDYQGAISDYNQAIRLNPQLVEAYVNRGWAYDELGDYPQAISDYNQVIRLNPKDAEAYGNRGLAYGKLGDISQALADLRQAADLFGQQKRMEDYQKALDLIQRFQQ